MSVTFTVLVASTAALPEESLTLYVTVYEPRVSVSTALVSITISPEMSPS